MSFRDISYIYYYTTCDLHGYSLRLQPREIPMPIPPWDIQLVSFIGMVTNYIMDIFLSQARVQVNSIRPITLILIYADPTRDSCNNLTRWGSCAELIVPMLLAKAISEGFLTVVFLFL